MKKYTCLLLIVILSLALCVPAFVKQDLSLELRMGPKL